MILKNDQGKTIVIPTKNILDKEIIIESGPTPATQEKAVEEKRGGSRSNCRVMISGIMIASRSSS